MATGALHRSAKTPIKAAVTFPLRVVQGEVQAYAQLGTLFTFAKNVQAQTIIIDCKRVTWLDAHMSAGYAAIIHMIRSDTRKHVAFQNLIPRVQEILEHHGLVGHRPSTPKASVVPVTQFSVGGGKTFAQYTQDHLARLPIPKMTEALKEKFFEGIDELFCNAELHSSSKLGMWAAGQHFPRKDLLDFTLVDLGIGFQERINKVRKLNLNPDQAIDWAMTGSNTTRSGDIPGGLGLKILRQFIQVNGGRLCIVSHGGCWTLSKHGAATCLLPTPFPGTAVTIEINTADRNSYGMSEESKQWMPEL